MFYLLCAIPSSLSSFPFAPSLAPTHTQFHRALVLRSVPFFDRLRRRAPPTWTTKPSGPESILKGYSNPESPRVPAGRSTVDVLLAPYQIWPWIRRRDGAGGGNGGKFKSRMKLNLIYCSRCYLKIVFWTAIAERIDCGNTSNTWVEQGAGM